MLETVSGEKKRELISLAIAAGRNYQSAQTKWIHLCYENESARDTIPFYENFCFCLALFRSLEKEHFQEGKERLEKLLAFQLEEGYFPTYFHTYPKKEHSNRSAFALHLIAKHYGAVLGPSIRSKLQKIAPLPFPPQLITSSKRRHLRLFAFKLKSSPSMPSPLIGINSCNFIEVHLEMKGKEEMRLIPPFLIFLWEAQLLLFLPAY